MLVSDAFASYLSEARVFGLSDKTTQNYITARNSFMTYVADKDVGDITAQDCVDWVEKMQQDNKSPSTISTNICRLRQVMRYAEENGASLSVRPEKIRAPKVYVKKIKPLHPNDIAWIIGFSGNLRDQLLLSFLFSTCCRISEALSINRDEIEGDKIVVVGKNFKFRPVFLDDRTMMLLERYLATRTDNNPALFVSGDGRRLSYSMASVVVSETAKKAGVGQRVTAHLYRHSGATDLMENGMHMRAIQQYLGHESILTTQRYTHVSDKFLKKSFADYHTGA